MLFRRRRRAADAARSPNGAEAAEPPPARDRELAAVTSLSSALARARDVPSVARTLLEECFSLLGVDFAAVALVSDDGKQAEGIAARDRSGESAWWLEVSLDFEHEPSGIASAVYEGAPVVVYDIAGSAGVNRRLAEKVGAKSAAFVPLVSGEQVPAVLVIATSEPKVFTSEELALLQALAAEAALALERTRSADALAEALERERLVASIGRKVRSELDLEAVLRVAVEETGKAAGVTRCFIRLGELGGPMPIRAEWDAEGFVPIGFSSERLPVSNLAAGEGRTVAVGDIREEPALDDPKLGGRPRGSHRRPRGPAARGERSPARAADSPAQGGPGGGERASSRHRPAKARRRGHEPARRGRRRLLPPRHRSRRAPLRGRQRPRSGAARARVSRRAGDRRALPGADPPPGLRGVRERNRRSDDVVG